MNYRRWTSGPNMERSFRKWAEQTSNNMWFPVDVEETAQQYTFVADVPGLGKNDIKVLFLSVLSQSIFDDLDAGLSTRVLCSEFGLLLTFISSFFGGGTVLHDGQLERH